MIRSDKLRKSAKGEDCTLQIVGICNHDNATTVLAHYPSDSHGMALKGTDISSGYACSDCHSAIDGRDYNVCYTDDWREFVNHREWYMRRSQTRTLNRWIEKGLVVI